MAWLIVHQLRIADENPTQRVTKLMEGQAVELLASFQCYKAPLLN